MSKLVSIYSGNEYTLDDANKFFNLTGHLRCGDYCIYKLDENIFIDDMEFCTLEEALEWLRVNTYDYKPNKLQDIDDDLLVVPNYIPWKQSEEYFELKSREIRFEYQQLLAALKSDLIKGGIFDLELNNYLLQTLASIGVVKSE